MDETQDIPIRESIQNNLVKAIRGDNASIENLVNLLTEMYENVNTNPSVQDTTEKEQELLNRVHELEHSIVLLETEVTNLKFDLAQTDDATRSKNLRIEGLPETLYEELASKVAALYDLLDNSDILTELDPNLCWRLILQKIINIADELCPLKQFRVKSNKPDWLTNELLELQRDREYFFDRARKTNNPGDWFIASRLRNRVNQAVRSAKADYIKGELEHCQHDPKKYWRVIDSVISANKHRQISFLDKNTGAKIAQEKIPDVINDFFASIGPRLARPFQNMPRTSNIFTPINNCAEFDLVPITEQDVIKKVNEISIYKSSGIDNISSQIMKDAVTIMITEFTHLYNRILVTGIFPDEWKCATVIPIPKKANPKSPNDLRPISLLPMPGKILEKLIHHQLTKFYEDTKYLTNTQNGFRKGKSTTNALATLLDDILMAMDHGSATLALYLDFKKAFDTINHNILIEKLVVSGLAPNTVNLISNYLVGRKQRTRIGNYTSAYQPLTTGVPQGSTLGPLLFLLYINDLPLPLQHTKNILFADTTCIYVSGSDPAELNRKVQTDLNNIVTWCMENQLTLNVDKTQFVTYTTRRRANKYANMRLELDKR